ncbi:hypothetical protein AN189_07275 [Loktanella sp. 3ANDIMAR09]|uniref:hypothetical protein n=1 Tax=Loktanella sp. 3ANDIMAR09 TaxID=1225657 RepID=UPI0006FAF3B8|nr:hypothetical protein [Loktanella sp. 3ANDIMAR09]KQI68698.1 hypothetical protein AN189_07275 [Loktanella sp. 3ANDIMAR09]
MAGYLIRAATIIPKDVAEIPEGQTVVAGQHVDLPEAYGSHLYDLKLAVFAGDGGTQESDEGDGGTQESDDDRLGVIVEVISNLDPDEDFTQGGLPDVKAVNAAMPDGSEPVSAAERDVAWSMISAQVTVG